MDVFPTEIVHIPGRLHIIVLLAECRAQPGEKVSLATAQLMKGIAVLPNGSIGPRTETGKAVFFPQRGQA